MTPSTARCVVFDIDGVLADVRHRLHFVESRPKDWDSFFAAMEHDPVLPRGAELVHEVLAAGHEIAYLTGRAEPYRGTTRAWLRRHDLPDTTLLMRPADDRRPARLFKPEALRRLALRADIAAVVDDDSAVVAALRAAGWSVMHADWAADEPTQQTLFDVQERDGRS